MLMRPDAGGHAPHPLHRLQGAQRPAPRARARHGLEPVRVRVRRGSARTARSSTGAAGGELRTFATEADAYAFLGLPFIEPELREDRGEIEAALAGRLPSLITEADLRGDLHSHSDWSDGTPDGRGHGRVRAPARPRLPGHDRPHAVPGDRARPRPRASRAGARADPLPQRAIRDGGGGGHRAARDAAPRASASSTAASWRSAPTASSTIRTSCSRPSTSSSRRCTSRGGRRAPS